MYKRLFFLLFVCGFAATVRGQVASSANGELPHLWAGAEYANFKPDWGLHRLPGVTIFADFAVRRRYGLEGEVRLLNFTKPDGLTEKSFLAGGYYTAYQRRRISGSVKLLIGDGLITYTEGIGYGSYFVYVPGGNVEYRIGRKWKARFDYEYQFMPSAPGLPPPIPNNGLTPSGFSGGLAYRIY